jgi:NAD(P)-dependent dehydrogenase (short-subunit alcohol dehydrogenase family)
LTSLPNVTAIELDVTNPAAIDAAVRTVQTHGHELDVLINNAGAGYTMPLLDADLDQDKQVYEANIWGPLRVMQGFADLLVAVCRDQGDNLRLGHG